MRIIGGTAAGVSLKVPKGFDIRPTPDLVRQAIFNSLGDRVPGARVLELFAGTAALSLECLSRGALAAVCVEKTSKHARLIEENLEAAHFERSAIGLRVQDAFAAIHQLARQEERFDLVLADPPYGDKNVGRRSTSFAQRLLDNEDLPALLSATGLLVLGHTKRDTLSVPPHWAEIKTLKHGDTRMKFLRFEEVAESTTPIKS